VSADSFHGDVTIGLASHCELGVCESANTGEPSLDHAWFGSIPDVLTDHEHPNYSPASYPLDDEWLCKGKKKLDRKKIIDNLPLFLLKHKNKHSAKEIYDRMTGYTPTSTKRTDELFTARPVGVFYHEEDKGLHIDGSMMRVASRHLAVF
jgi:hypothetical protein